MKQIDLAEMADIDIVDVAVSNREKQELLEGKSFSEECFDAADSLLEKACPYIFVFTALYLAAHIIVAVLR